MTSFVQIAHLTSIDCFRTIKYDSSLYAKQQQLSKWRPSPMFANNFMLFALVYFLDAYFKLLRLLAAKACRLNCWLLAKLARNLPNLWYSYCCLFWELGVGNTNVSSVLSASTFSLCLSFYQLPMSNANLTMERMQQRGNFKGKCATRRKRNEHPSACQILKKYSQVYYAHKYIYIWLCI